MNATSSGDVMEDVDRAQPVKNCSAGSQLKLAKIQILRRMLEYVFEA